MGYMRHHAIVVTTYADHLTAEAHAAAKSFGCTVTEIVQSPINGYTSFLVVPDGSKENWPDDLAGDDQRKQLVEWLESKRYEDGSTSFDYVEVQYGDEDGDTSVISASDWGGNRVGV